MRERLSDYPEGSSRIRAAGKAEQRLSSNRQRGWPISRDRSIPRKFVVTTLNLTTRINPGKTERARFMSRDKIAFNVLLYARCKHNACN